MVLLNESETKLNRAFKDTGFTFKQAIDELQDDPKPLTVPQMTRKLTREHKALMEKIFPYNPKEKMKYLKMKLEGIRVTGDVEKKNRPNMPASVGTKEDKMTLEREVN